MDEIKLRIPGFAVDLMCKTTPQMVYDGMITNKKLSFQEMQTFGGVITPIYWTESGVVHSFVVYWVENGMVSLLLYEPERDYLVLAGIDAWGKIPPSCDDALEIFNRLKPDGYDD